MHKTRLARFHYCITKMVNSFRVRSIHPARCRSYPMVLCRGKGFFELRRKKKTTLSTCFLRPGKRDGFWEEAVSVRRNGNNDDDDGIMDPSWCTICTLNPPMAPSPTPPLLPLAEHDPQPPSRGTKARAGAIVAKHRSRLAAGTHGAAAVVVVVFTIRGPSFRMHPVGTQPTGTIVFAFATPRDCWIPLTVVCSAVAQANLFK